MAPVAGSRRRRRSTRGSATGAARSSKPQKDAARRRSGRPRRSSPEPSQHRERTATPLEDIDEDEEPQYQHLAPVMRGVDRYDIETKWAPLPPKATDQISALLSDVERSVIVRLQDERKITMASTALQMVVRRLQKKLSRGQPFPPSTRPLIEEDFDFERLIDSGRELESRLTPLLHSVELLKSEIRKEAELLEEETAALEALEANAQGEASKRKRTAKTTHDILFDDVDTKAGVKLEEFVSTDRDDEYKISEVIDKDKDFAQTIDQLFQHLESIQSNVSQIEGLGTAMAGSRAALEEVLFRHFGSIRYGQVTQ